MSDDKAIEDAVEVVLARREEEKKQEKLRIQTLRMKKRENIYRIKFDSFTEDLHPAYLSALEETGMYQYAADMVNCNVHNIQDYRRDNPDFQDLCNQAIDRYRGSFILAAQERAIDGYKIPIIGGRNRDQIITYETRYSDRLMELFLKRASTGEFTEKQIVSMEGQVDIRQEMDLASLSKRAKEKLRELLEIINDDNIRRGLGEVVE